ncbi:MAG: hypothetical protein KC996_11065 [Phycisphaerales bacterium]|nr:hypothetical protein [Phycisphaerales bacterium]
MNTPRTTAAIGMSSLALLLIAGCGQTRSASLSNEHQASYCDAEASPVFSAASEELVIGAEYASDQIPVYDRPVQGLELAEVANELIDMHNRDRELVRDSIDPKHQNKARLAMINAIDRAHAARLKEIVDCIGWPTRGTVGLEATEGAYLVIQHAGHDTAFQERCLEMMHDLVDRGELPAPYIALLTDRIRVFNGQPQVYGTQMTLARDSEGVMRPVPITSIEFPDQLDDRRAKMGMPAHDRFVQAIAQAYAASLVEPNSRYASVPTE